MKKIYYIGGMKGGVGKSLCAHVLTDALIAAGNTPLLIETDTANPDLYKCFKDALDVQMCSLNSEADDTGWRSFITLLSENEDKTIVVNTPAQNNAGFAMYGPLLNTLPGLAERLVPLWVIDGGRDCLELLADFLDVIDIAGAVHVVKNGYHAKESAFTIFDESKTKKRLAAAGGKVIFMPKLIAPAASKIYAERRNIKDILEGDIDMGLRVFLESWRNTMHKNLAGVLE